jgi:hypothetical protein
MRSIGLIRTATPPPDHDLWPRLLAQLRAQEEHIALRFPTIGWREATAAAVVLGTLFVVPDPVRFLSACGLL